MNIYLLAGIPIFFVSALLVTMFFARNTKPVIQLGIAKAAANLANANYYRIKEKLAIAKPLVRLRFRLLVGPKRYKDYTYQG